MNIKVKRKVKRALVFVVEKLHLKREYILFESYPELDGSPWMIYQELINRGFDKRYKLRWLVDKSFKAPPNVPCVNFFNGSFLQEVKSCYLLAKAKVIIDSNRWVYKTNQKTFRLHTKHGAPLKGVYFYTSKLGNVDAVLSLSEELIDIEEKNSPSAKGKIIPLGFPTNDRLFENVDLYKLGFWEKITGQKEKFDRIIGWLPTYRQHRNGSKSGRASFVHPYGIPIIKHKDELENLNEVLKTKNALLAIQIHHAQMKNFSDFSYSNIVLIPQSLKYEMNISTINLMCSFDAMITDYSSAYHEYLLLDRPIGLSIDDYDVYYKKPGFCLDYFEWIKGFYIKSFDDLLVFIQDTLEGRDVAKSERESALLRIHKNRDAKSTMRVVDYLIRAAKL